MKRKILIHSITFSPDGVSTAYLYNDIARAFRSSGYEVVVLTTTPHYNVLGEELAKQPLQKRFFGLYYTSDFEGIPVIHIPQKKYRSTLLRLAGFVYWHIMSLILGLSISHVMAILSPSPPLTIGFINILLGRIKKARVIYNVQEIYPDFLVGQGGLKSGLAIRILKWMERFVYNQSDAVTTIDQVFYDTIAPRFRDQSKLHIIPNFVDTDLYKPYEPALVRLDRSLFPENDHLKVLYAGNIGHAQDWEPLIHAAFLLKEVPIEFFVIGEGVMKDWLLTEAREKGLEKLHILPYQPRESMPHLLAYADLQFIFMSKELEAHGFPSKVYTIMACQKPLLVCSGKNTPIVNFLNPLGCAKLITTPDFEQKVSGITSFLKNADRPQLRQMGKNGHQVILSEYTKNKVTGKYVDLMNALLNK